MQSLTNSIPYVSQRLISLGLSFARLFTCSGSPSVSSSEAGTAPVVNRFKGIINMRIYYDFTRILY